MDFRFEFLDIHMNEKVITCHDVHGFQWQIINVCSILTIFLYNLTPLWDVKLWLHLMVLDVVEYYMFCDLYNFEKVLFN
jgi:hypothetical protein